MQINQVIKHNGWLEVLGAEGMAHAVPDDPANADRRAILAWEAAGGVIQDPPVDLEKMHTEAQWALKSAVDRFVAHKPDGAVRYDAALAGNLRDAALAALEAGQEPPAPVLATRAWKQSLIAAYFERKAALAAAATPQELAAVEVSHAWFEERFGVAGSVHPDPDVSTTDLMSY